jgi:small conductance mechanosensitive channel
MPENLIALIPTILARIAAATVTLLIGRWLARRSREWVRKALSRTGLTASLIRLFATLTYATILIVSVLTALGFLGVPLEALLASAGIVIIVLGVALRESLANFAATVIFLLFPAYKIGDIIETCAVMGEVTEILLFQTVITTFDKRIVTLTNGQIQTNGVTNRSRMGILRADVNVGIRYEDDLPRAKRILEELLAEDARVLAEPAPAVLVTDFVSSGVILSARPFAAFNDAFNLQCDLRERIKLRFDEAGVSIAFPLVTAAR